MCVCFIQRLCVCVILSLSVCVCVLRANMYARVLYSVCACVISLCVCVLRANMYVCMCQIKNMLDEAMARHDAELRDTSSKLEVCLITALLPNGFEVAMSALSHLTC